MKKIILFIIAAIAAPFMLNAQSGIYANDDGVIISDSTGRSVVAIKPSGSANEGFSLSISGFEIDFETYGGKQTVSTPVSKNKHKQPGKRRYRSSLTTFELGFSEFKSPDYSMYGPEEQDFINLKGSQSIHFGWNIFKSAIPLNRSRTLGMSTGFGIVWNNYVFSEKIKLVSHGGMIHPEPIDPSYKKSKLTTFSFTVPVILELNFRRMSVSGGFYGNLVLSEHTKIKKPKEKNKRDSFYVNTFQAGTTMRVGFKRLCFFANYNLTDYFKSGKGPGTQPLTMGIGFF